MSDGVGTTTNTTPIALVFGCNFEGQCGCPGQDEYFSPCRVPEDSVDAAQVIKVCSSQKQTFLLTKEGSVFTTGENDNNELGRSGKRSAFSRLDALEGFKIVDLTVGEGYSILVAKEGNCVSWGRNESGQLGLGEGKRENVQKPKPFTILREGVSQVAAGKDHTLFLSRSGNLYACGANRKGQLGDGQLTSCALPKLINQLLNRPITKIACGADFSMCLTVGGSCYSWGDNTQGQLGCGDTITRLRPELIRSLRAAKVVQIAAGKMHAAAITPSGLLFTWGSNSYGQLGHGEGSERVCPSPRIVDKFQQSEKTVVDCALGAAHSLVLVKPTDEVYVMGNGASGALGLGDGIRGTCFTPTLLLKQLTNGMRPAGVGTSSLSNHSFVFSEGVPLQRAPLPFVTLEILRTACARLSKSTINTTESNNALKNIREIVAAAFSSIPVLNASFRLPLREGLCIDLPQVRQAYTLLLECNNEHILSTLSRATFSMTNELTNVIFDDAENLSCFLICFENPLLLNSTTMAIALERLVNGILSLPLSVQQTLFGWLKSYPSEYFTRILLCLQGFLQYSLQALNSKFNAQICRVLQSLYRVNCECDIVPEAFFVMTSLSTHVNLVEERRSHLDAILRGHNTRVFNFLQYPFLFSVQTKAAFLRLDFEASKASKQYKAKMLFQATGVLPPGCVVMQREDGTPELFFELVVHRQNIVLDAFSQILRIVQSDPATLSLPLKVKFVGEDGIDAGGVSKELFTLACRELVARTDILRPTPSTKFSFFSACQSDEKPVASSANGIREKLDRVQLTMYMSQIKAILSPEDSKVSTTVAASSSCAAQYCLGLLLGLASYNGCLLDIRIPPCVYKLMMMTDTDADADGDGETLRLRSRLRLQDIYEIDHRLASSLQDLLDYDESNMEEVLGITFCASDCPLFDDCYSIVDLVPGGRDIMVNKANRQLYVAKFVQHALYGCRREPIRAYITGLSLLFNGVTVDLSTPLERETLLCGSSEIGDLSLLRLAATYRGGVLTDEHPIANAFWDVISSLSHSDQQKFLSFVTGSDRVPAGGIGLLRLQIQHSTAESDETLPTSHTCFHLIDLPLYSSPSKMREKLLLALANCEGFGLH